MDEPIFRSITTSHVHLSDNRDSVHGAIHRMELSQIWVSSQFTSADCVQLYPISSLRLLPGHSTAAYAGKGRHSAWA